MLVSIRMKRRRFGIALVAALVVCVEGVSVGQSAWPFELRWEHDGSNVSHFDVCVDGRCEHGAAQRVSEGGATWRMSVPAMTEGEHRLVVRACNQGSCTGGRARGLRACPGRAERPGTARAVPALQGQASSARHPALAICRFHRWPRPRPTARAIDQSPSSRGRIKSASAQKVRARRLAAVAKALEKYGRCASACLGTVIALTSRERRHAPHTTTCSMPLRAPLSRSGRAHFGRSRTKPKGSSA